MRAGRRHAEATNRSCVGANDCAAVELSRDVPSAEMYEALHGLTPFLLRFPKFLSPGRWMAASIPNVAHDLRSSASSKIDREPVNPLGEMRSWVKTDHPAVP